MIQLNLGEQLIDEAVAGDPLAFQALLLSHRVRLIEYIKRHLPQELQGVMEPDDVLQDTCMEAFRRIREFSPTGPDAVARWLMTITRHRIIDLLRAHRTVKRGGLRSSNQANGHNDDSAVVNLLASLAVYHRTPSKSAAAHELTAALERSIDCLPPHYRQAIRLRHVEGLPAKDAAALMQRTEGAFHLLCNRGLKQLRVAMRSESIYV